VAHDGDEMTELIHKVLSEPSFAEDLAKHGLETIQQRHTCAHRVDELLAIYEQVGNESKRMVAAL